MKLLISLTSFKNYSLNEAKELYYKINIISRKIVRQKATIFLNISDKTNTKLYNNERNMERKK